MLSKIGGLKKPFKPLISMNAMLHMDGTITQIKNTLNYVALVAKYFIFCCIQDNASVIFDSFPAFLKSKIDTLQQIALKNKQLEHFNNKWKNFI